MWVIRQLAVTVLSLTLSSTILLGSASVALGADSEANGLPPTVSFSDTSTLDLSKERLEVLAREGGLGVKVHNGLGRAQRVSLEAIGLESPDESTLAGLFAKSSDSRRVPAGSTATLRLELTDPLPDIEEGAYATTLIAFGARGGLARRDLTITYPTTSNRTETPGEDSLSPTRPIDITLHAVNYLPSLLSNLLGLGIFLAIAVVAIAVLFRRLLYVLGARLPKAIGAGGHGPFGLVLGLGILCGAVTLVGLIEDGVWDSPGFHAISPRPVALAPSVPDGVRGTVSSENGAIAQLIAADGKLRPENLGGADKYVGKYDLGGEPEKTRAAATVTIRDFWIYAVAAITLGLLVGFVLHRWFQEQRPTAKLLARLERLRHNYDADISVTSLAYKNSPYKNAHIDGRMLSREREIKTLLEAGDFAQANTKLLELDAYLDRFATLREKRRNLETAVTQLEHADLSQLGLSLAEASGYQSAHRLLIRAADPSDLDSGEDELKGDIEKVDELVGLIQGTSEQIEDTNSWLESATKLKDKCAEKQLITLGQAEIALKEASREALQADSIDSLKAAREKGKTGMRQLAGLRTAIKTAAAAEAMQPAAESPGMLALQSQLADSVRTEDEILLTAVKPRAPKPPQVRATVSFEAIGVEKPANTRIHLEDRVRFTIEFHADEQATFPSQVEIDFGEGEPVTYTVPRPGEPLTAFHHYRTQPRRSMTVRQAPDGKLLADPTPLEIDPEPRLLPRQDQLAKTDRAVGTAAFILAVGSGLVALYITDPSWGEPMDYLAAFIWGGATGQGVQIAANLADRVWPAS